MNILITGAGKGIGYSIVKLFAGQKNNTIYSLSRNTDKLEILKIKCAGKIIPVKFDLCSLLKEKTLPGELSSANKIDILINNAGYLVNKSFTNIEAIDIQNILDVNFTAPVILTQLLIPKFNSTGAHIVNIGSMGGFQGSDKFPGLSIYSSSKAAIASLTECLANEFKGSHLSFNCLAIGSVQTEMLNKAFPGYKAPLTPDEMAEFIVDFALKGHKFMNGKIVPVALMSP